MVEDRDFKSMMDEREAGKARGPPASSHFAKMQNATIWGVKPNVMGEDKDWPMPKDIPEAKTTDDSKGEHVEKKDGDVKAADEIGDSKTPKAVSPLMGEGNLTTMKSAITKTNYGHDVEEYKKPTAAKEAIDNHDTLSGSNKGIQEGTIMLADQNGGRPTDATESSIGHRSGPSDNFATKTTPKKASAKEMPSFRDMMIQKTKKKEE